MLRILERATRPNSGSGAEGVAPSVAEYWLEATERIMDDMDCTLEQKSKGAVFLLRDEAYQWWLTVKEGTQPNRLTWEFFKTTFQRKYVGVSYVDARRSEFLNLTQGDQSVAEYEGKFLRFSRYARGIVVSEYERCAGFEDGLRDNLRVLIAPQRERKFYVLVEKAEIAEDVKRAKCQNRDRERDIGSTHSYIASTVSGNLGITVENTMSEVTVLSPLG
ncbi:uncharacterized protein [Gossypium hirsutum]|uniref:Retrotransposon gag domain-containing protein n=1 Tax=Gossypium hirsutum TaxID=3635 RepID=A0A1U8NFR1_GOSHI|nr:uncharacterized protein LOC107947880 [Gossypium hirsutum]